MILTPTFKSHLRVELLPPDSIFIFDEDEHHAFQGELLYSVVSCIDGNTTTGGIKQRLRSIAVESDVEACLLLMEAEGFLIDASQKMSPPLSSICDFFHLNPPAAQARLKRSRVTVETFGAMDPEPLSKALAELGILASPALSRRSSMPAECWRSSLTVVLVEDYLHEALPQFNADAIRNQQKWLIAKPTGNIFWIGPAFFPGHGPCWQCLATRLKEKRRAEQFIAANKKIDVSLDLSRGLPTTFNAAVNLIADAALKRILGVEFNQLITFDSRQMSLQHHHVIRLDHCPSCANALSAKTSLRLRARNKIYIPPETTYAKYQHHISRVTGIVDDVISYGPTNDGVVHSYIAGHIFLPRSDKEDLFRRGLVQQSGGKGITSMHAKVSAVCEALERYSGVFRGNEIRRSATVEELGDMAILPNECMNFSERQFRFRNQWNRTHHKHDWVPVRFDPEKRIDWTPVWSLTHKKTKYIPTAYCYYGYPMDADDQFCRADSNGNAGGNSLEEAIVHGFLELVERDAAAIWWFNQITRPAVDLENFQLSYISDLQKHYAKLNRDFWVLDITADYPIPAFVALSNIRKSRSREFLVGFGADFDPAVALLRALTEMNQFLPGLSSKNRNGILQPAEDDINFLLPPSSIPLKKRSEYHSYNSQDYLQDIHLCVKMAAKRGMEMLVLDQTRRDVGLPVAKVIVPGMRQFWPRLGKGRLYEVPVKLGWQKKARSERELNQDRIVI